MALSVDAEHPDGSRCGPGNCERVLETVAKAGVKATKTTPLRETERLTHCSPLRSGTSVRAVGRKRLAGVVSPSD